MLRYALQLVVSLAFLMAAARLHAESWTQFRGADFGRTSNTRLARQWDAEHIAWKTPLPGRGASSPVVFGDRVYLTAYTGYGIDPEEPGDPGDLERHLLCIRATDGSVLWQKTVPATLAKNPFTTWAVALHGYASSTPAVDPTGVYVFFGATGVLAFDHEGNERWRVNCGTGTHSFGAGNSPVLHDELVIVNASVESGDLIALAKSDGREVWRQSGIRESWNTPALYQGLGGVTEVAVTIEGRILAFAAETGEPLWNCDGIDDYICPSIIVQDGILYALGGRRGVAIAVRSGGRGDVSDSHKLWEIAKGSNVSSPVYHDGHLYWAKEKSGILYCADASTGEVVYEERLRPSPGLIYASPLLAGDRLYFVSRENGIFVVAAEPEFQLLGHTRLEGDQSLFNASPVPLPDGSVLLRSDSYLYRIQPATEGGATSSVETNRLGGNS
jgi:outer membrane protein assembly factor BamB